MIRVPHEDIKGREYRCVLPHLDNEKETILKEVVSLKGKGVLTLFFWNSQNTEL